MEIIAVVWAYILHIRNVSGFDKLVSNGNVCPKSKPGMEWKPVSRWFLWFLKSRRDKTRKWFLYFGKKLSGFSIVLHNLTIINNQEIWLGPVYQEMSTISSCIWKTVISFHKVIILLSHRPMSNAYCTLTNLLLIILPKVTSPSTTGPVTTGFLTYLCRAVHALKNMGSNRLIQTEQTQHDSLCKRCWFDFFTDTIDCSYRAVHCISESLSHTDSNLLQVIHLHKIHEYHVWTEIGSWATLCASGKIYRHHKQQIKQPHRDKRLNSIQIWR